MRLLNDLKYGITLIDRKQNGKNCYMFDLLSILLNSDAFS